MIKHIVKQGECLSSIAAAYGFGNWKLVYNDGANADLRKKRPDPNILFPGDAVMIPDKDDGTADGATGKDHKFTLKRPKRKIEVRMLDQHKLPMKDEPYTAVAGGLMVYGVTTGEGDLTLELPVDATDVKIWIACQQRTLALGSLNPIEDTVDDGVSGVQGRLLGLGFNPGAIDGEMGPKTKSAIVAFQRHYKLDVTGEADDATTARLKKEYRS